MNRNCAKCLTSFEVFDEDLTFLERIAPVINNQTFPVPPPRNCPQCREQIRMAFRNERHLFARECSHSREKLISCHEPNAVFPVFKNAFWWEDRNDAKKFARQVDFKRPIMGQIYELQCMAPRVHTFNYAEERQVNSVYTNCSGDLKDCYLIFAAGRNERCYYSIYMTDCFNCMDCFFVINLTNCYQCIDCETCHSVLFSQASKNCSDSYFLYDCRGCTHCIGCVGLRQKEYHVLNQPVSKSEFQQTLQQLQSGHRQPILNLEHKFQQLLATKPRRYIHGDKIENCTGDYIWNSKNCFNCFDTNNAEDCRYCTWYDAGKDTMDQFSWGESELCYQVTGGGEAMYHCLFTSLSYGCRDCYYIDLCHYCKDCFACVGLKNEQYCILNQQYGRGEYFDLLPKIIRQMISTGEWGEYFHLSMSSFAYNYSVANDYYPLTKSQALALGFLWSDYEPPQAFIPKSIAACQLPESIEQVSDDILSFAVVCETSGKPFRMIREELDFYYTNRLPLPTKHPDQRYKERLAMRNPRRLWNRRCAMCSTFIETSYSPERPELVYCNECYLAEVH